MQKILMEICSLLFFSGINVLEDLESALFSRILTQVLSIPQDYCQWESFNVTCPDDSFILVTSAKYGRMRVGRCLPVDYFVGCAVDVWRQMDEKCSGRRNCTVNVSDRKLFSVQPCRKDLVAFLEADYKCVKISGTEFLNEGSTMTSSMTHTSIKSADHLTPPTQCQQPIKINSTSGYLSPDITTRSGLGSGQCPWHIDAKPGQRISLRAVTFGPKPSYVTDLGKDNTKKDSVMSRDKEDTKGSRVDPLECAAMASVAENWQEKSPQSSLSSSKVPQAQKQLVRLSSCVEDPPPNNGRYLPYVSHTQQQNVDKGGDDTGSRIVSNYVSEDHSVYVHMINSSYLNIKQQNSTSRPYFVHFEVIGCPDVIPPPYTWTVRTGDSLMITCNRSRERWHIICSGNTWIGADVIGNCSTNNAAAGLQPPQGSSKDADESGKFHSSGDSEITSSKNFPLGLLVAVTVGVVIGITVGFGFLLLVCFCRKRYQKSRGLSRRKNFGPGSHESPSDTGYPLTISSVQSVLSDQVRSEYRPFQLLPSSPCAGPLAYCSSPLAHASACHMGHSTTYHPNSTYCQGSVRSGRSSAGDFTGFSTVDPCTSRVYGVVTSYNESRAMSHDDDDDDEELGERDGMMEERRSKDLCRNGSRCQRHQHHKDVTDDSYHCTHSLGREIQRQRSLKKQHSLENQKQHRHQGQEDQQDICLNHRQICHKPDFHAGPETKTKELQNERKHQNQTRQPEDSPLLTNSLHSQIEV